MKIDVFDDADSVARAAAAMIAADARAGIAARGSFVMAVSGGHTPWLMLQRWLAKSWLGTGSMWCRWMNAAPSGDPDRNLTHLRVSLLQRAPLAREQIHPMPVESADLQAAATEYEEVLRGIAGVPPVLDVAHLGLGADGHTASLVPGDPVVDVNDRDVAVTGLYQGKRRMTLTYPILNRARRVIWIVTGRDKAEVLHRLRDGDISIPAGRIRREQAVVLADRAAAGLTAR